MSAHRRNVLAKFAYFNYYLFTRYSNPTQQEKLINY